MAIGMLISYSVQILGDGITTTFSLDFAKSAKLTTATPGGGFIDGIEVGAPVSVDSVSVAGASATLSGRTVTITFATAPTSAMVVQIIMVY